MMGIRTLVEAMAYAIACGYVVTAIVEPLAVLVCSVLMVLGAIVLARRCADRDIGVVAHRIGTDAQYERLMLK